MSNLFHIAANTAWIIFICYWIIRGCYLIGTFLHNLYLKHKQRPRLTSDEILEHLRRGKNFGELACVLYAELRKRNPEIYFELWASMSASDREYLLNTEAFLIACRDLEIIIQESYRR